MDLETRIAEFEDIPDDLGAFGVMGQEGDTKHIWNPKKPDEVEAARVLFDTLTKKGYLAFKLTRLGTKGKPVPEFDDAKGRVLFAAPKTQDDGERITAFDPTASRVLFTPRFSGG
jgi:hypothetical protein